MRILALDYGRARTGVAVSDPTGTLARPVATIRRVRSTAGMEELLRMIDQHRPERLVVGLPLTLRGQEGDQARETRAFVAELRRRCPLPVELEDERFTTALAGAAGRRDDEDAVAAAHLLEGYLRRLAG
jgi:putative Holliday junction resolvase